MSRVVNHEAVKAALVLAAVDPSVGGVAIHGRRGTCKTVLVRATHALLPAHDVVPSSVTNANPDTPWEWETGLLDRVAEDARARLVAAGVDVPRRPSPGALVAAAAALDPKWNRRTLHPNFVTVPLAATEDAVAGSVDVEASVRRGAPVFAPGLLARAHRGVLYLDELNLMDDAVANLIFAVVAAGENKVEREGVSASHACAPLVFATFNPDEGDVREPLLDRFAMVVSADAPLDREQRVEGVAIAARWQDDWRAVAKECEDEEDDAALEVVAARAVLPTVRISNDAIATLVERAMALGCVGHRAELFAAKIARAAAARREARPTSPPKTYASPKRWRSRQERRSTPFPSRRRRRRRERLNRRLLRHRHHEMTCHLPKRKTCRLPNPTRTGKNPKTTPRTNPNPNLLRTR